MEKAFVLPGELAFSKEPTYISTVLGSCVAVCIFDASKRIGGVNHFVVPEAQAGGMEGNRVAETAIKSLLKEFLVAGSKISSLKAEIYGGAKVVTAFNTIADIGDRNVLKARQILTELKIVFNLRETGGTLGRKLIFDTSTGRVHCSEIEKTLENSIAKGSTVKPINYSLPGVMIVDDSPTVRKIVRGAIEASGKLRVVAEAENPYEAKEKLTEVIPDVICLDVMMPKMNGLDFLKRIMFYKPIPVVILSTLVKNGNKLWTDLQKAGALGAINKDEMKIYNTGNNLQDVLIPKLLLATKTKVFRRDPNTGKPIVD